jgi:hypothetical protein
MKVVVEMIYDWVEIEGIALSAIVNSHEFSRGYFRGKKLLRASMG